MLSVTEVVEEGFFKELYTAVGRVTVNWSLLEAVSDQQIAVTADICNVPLPAEFWRKEFINRLRAWEDMLINKYPHKGFRDSCLSLIGKIKSSSGRRHEITHRSWRAGSKRGEPHIAILLPNHHRREFEWKTSPDKVSAFADKIFNLVNEVLTIGPEYDIAVNASPRKSRSRRRNG